MASLAAVLLLLDAGWIPTAAAQPSPPATSLAPSAQGQPKARKVLLIGLDGIRSDILAKAHTPNIDRLIADGTFSDEAQSGITISGPGWSSMLTGVWHDKHRVENNDFTGHNYAAYPDFLTRLEQVNPGFRTLAVVDWPPLGLATSGGPLISNAVDVKLAINGDNIGYGEADAQSVDLAAYYLAREDPDAAFVYVGNTDVVGHEKGSLSPEYLAAIEQADELVGQLIAAVQSRPTYTEENWLILMSTDHGRTDSGSHGGTSDNEERIFFLASGPSAVKGRPSNQPALVDIVATALAHLGVEVEPAWGLDGQVVGLSEQP